MFDPQFAKKMHGLAKTALEAVYKPPPQPAGPLARAQVSLERSRKDLERSAKDLERRREALQKEIEKMGLSIVDSHDALQTAPPHPLRRRMFRGRCCCGHVNDFFRPHGHDPEGYVLRTATCERCDALFLFRCEQVSKVPLTLGYVQLDHDPEIPITRGVYR